MTWSYAFKNEKNKTLSSLYLDNSISVDALYERNAVMYQQVQDSAAYNYPVVLLSHNFQLSDHLMNIMGIELYESNEMPSKKAADILPNVFLILAISEPLIFGNEFMEGLLKQDYPKENIIVCICTKKHHSGINYYIALNFQRMSISPCQKYFKY